MNSVLEVPSALAVITTEVPGRVFANNQIGRDVQTLVATCDFQNGTGIWEIELFKEDRESVIAFYNSRHAGRIGVDPDLTVVVLDARSDIPLKAQFQSAMERMAGAEKISFEAFATEVTRDIVLTA